MKSKPLTQGDELLEGGYLLSSVRAEIVDGIVVIIGKIVLQKLRIGHLT